MHAVASTSSRVLYDVPCVVCNDHSSGKHYGVYACDGCAGFFKRSVRRNRQYACKERKPGSCLVDKAHRNQCRACRFTKCLNAGMNKDAVQHERGPRNSTIRRQMALFLNESTPDVREQTPRALDLVMTTHQPTADALSPPVHPPVHPPVFPPVPPLSALSLYPNPYRFLYGGLNAWSPQPPILSTMRSAPLMTLPITSPAELSTAALKIVFLNINWIRYLPSFDGFSIPDKKILLEESWKDLFVISLVQFMHPVNLRLLIRREQFINIQSVDNFQMILNDLYRIQADINEYSCFRAIAVFNYIHIATQSKRHFEDMEALSSLSNFYQYSLHQYEYRVNPIDISRMALFMQTLRNIKIIRDDIIEELFLRPTIGNVSVENIITEMYTTRSELNVF